MIQIKRIYDEHVTLLYSAKDPVHNHAVELQQFLAAKGRQ